MTQTLLPYTLEVHALHKTHEGTWTLLDTIEPHLQPGVYATEDAAVNAFEAQLIEEGYAFEPVTLATAPHPHGRVYELTRPDRTVTLVHVRTVVRTEGAA